MRMRASVRRTGLFAKGWERWSWWGGVAHRQAVREKSKQNETIPVVAIVLLEVFSFLHLFTCVNLTLRSVSWPRVASGYNTATGV